MVKKGKDGILVKVSRETHRELKKIGRMGDTFDSVIRRLVENYKKNMRTDDSSER